MLNTPIQQGNSHSVTELVALCSSEMSDSSSPSLICPHLLSFNSQIFQRNGAVVCFDSSSEEDCNWMMLVRPATDHTHQNLTAYQQDDGVYFNTSQVLHPV